MIRLRDIPGVGPLEWALAQNGWNEETTDWAAGLSEHIFGIAEEDTHPCADEHDQIWIGGVEVHPQTPDEMLAMEAKWEANFDVLKQFRDDSDAYWASVGWDVTDGEGKQLEAMRELGRPLVCIVKKIHADAELNLDTEQDAEDWGAQLEEDAKRFKAKP